MLSQQLLDPGHSHSGVGNIWAHGMTIRYLFLASAILFAFALSPLALIAIDSRGVGLLIDLLVGPDVDAPDNWALALQRCGYFCSALTSCSVVLASIAFAYKVRSA